MTRHPHLTRWPTVEGYCTPLSVAAGDRVELRASGRTGRCHVEVTRVGAERVPMWSTSDLAVGDHDVPDRAFEAGCRWPVAVAIPTDRSWPSGFYEVRMTANGDDPFDDDQRRRTSEAWFVVRRPEGAAPADLLLALSTNTWNAYNQWGGACMYSGADTLSFERPIERGYLRRPAAPFDVDFDGRITNVAEPSDPEHQRLVDYQRANIYPLWSASSGWHNWERRFVRWAESRGLTIDVAVNADLDRDGEAVLDGHRCLVSVGHDEYWSWGMRDTVDAWVRHGGRWAVFSGNTCFWQVRLEGSAMVCFKGAARFRDPVARSADRSRLTSMWSDPWIGRPESSTIGLSFTRGGYHRVGLAVPDGTGAYTVHRPDHWALSGTGLASGDELGRGSFIVGYEVDGCALDTSGPQPVPTFDDGTPVGLEVVASAPARLISITDDRCEAPAALWASVDPPGDLEGVAMVLFGDASPENVARIADGHAVMASVAMGEGEIFHGGSADWAYGLDADPLVGKVTANVIERFCGRQPSPG